MIKETLERRAYIYKRDFGEEALLQAIKEQENKYIHYGKEDYIDIMYYENEEPKYLLLIGDVLQYADYIIAKINQKHEVYVSRKLNGKHFSLVKYDVLDFI